MLTTKANIIDFNFLLLFINFFTEHNHEFRIIPHNLFIMMDCRVKNTNEASYTFIAPLIFLFRFYIFFDPIALLYQHVNARNCE